MMHEFLNINIDGVVSEMFENRDRNAIRECSKLLAKVLERRGSDGSYGVVRDKYARCVLFFDNRD